MAVRLFSASVLVLNFRPMPVLVRRPMSIRQWRGRRQDELTRFDALGSDQSVGQCPDRLAGSAQQDHFQAAVGVKVHVSRRDNAVDVLML